MMSRVTLMAWVAPVTAYLNFRWFTDTCYALKMITVVIETFARCQLYRLLWP